MLRAVLSSLAVAGVAASVPPSDAVVAPPSDPASVALRAVAAYLNLTVTAMRNISEYGPAIATAAVYAVARDFDGPFAPAVDAFIDAFVAEPATTAWNVLHNVTVPWGYSVGDQIGLMPLPLIARARFHNISYPQSDLWTISERVADEYVMQWPLRLADGTIARSTGVAWYNASEPAAFLWDDDQFMGTAVLAELARTPGFPPAKARAYVDELASLQLSFAAHMQLPSGLFPHGFHAPTATSSCCVWGRANGWIMMSHADVVRAIAEVAPDHPQLPAVIAVWRKHAAAFVALQDAKDGRWHQVLDTPATFLETSVTAMVAYSLAEGVRGGWLDATIFTPVVRNAWRGISAQVAANGTVAGICAGTAIGADVEFYEERPTTYLGSAPGLGSIFRAALAVARLG